MVHGIREAPSCPIWGNDSDLSTSATEYSDEDSDTSNDPGETMPTRFANMIVPFSEQLAGEAGRSARARLLFVLCGIERLLLLLLGLERL